MLLYRLPQFLSVTLPIAVVITVVVVLVRLSNDLELTAMGASGLSPWQLSVPVATFGLLATILDLGITLWMQPAGYAAYEEETLRLLRSQTAKTIRPGVLNYDFPGKVLYVESKSPNEELEGIFISDTELRPSSMVSLSSKGQLLIREKEQDILLQLKQGTMHFGNVEGGYRTMDFEEFQYQFRAPQLDGSQNRKVWGVSSMDLIQTDQYFGEQTRLGTSTQTYDTDGLPRLRFGSIDHWYGRPQKRTIKRLPPSSGLDRHSLHFMVFLKGTDHWERTNESCCSLGSSDFDWTMGSVSNPIESSKLERTSGVVLGSPAF